MPTWVIEKALARSSRPGYGGEHGKPVPQHQVDAWLAEAKAFGIKAIICLLGHDQLRLYGQLPLDLLSYYSQAGFEVEHIPVLDHQHPAMSQMDLAKVWAAYVKLPKPVLIHCSAGIDRTGMAVQYIQQKLATQS